ncbi:SEL1-like repeat protein [Neisseria bacilliformis]|uniref:SEL1-like repeat protein n=1 Tax=Neisseria bacilliformis TaxID=267212 RepID=UPI000B0476B5|nr:SEL1-like repeat protein [Neisseria bacilliformis]
MNALGAMYEKGEGMPASRDTAVSWYRKAAAAGDADVKTAAEAALARLGAAQ